MGQAGARCGDQGRLRRLAGIEVIAFARIVSQDEANSSSPHPRGRLQEKQPAHQGRSSRTTVRRLR